MVGACVVAAASTVVGASVVAATSTVVTSMVVVGMPMVVMMGVMEGVSVGMVTGRVISSGVVDSVSLPLAVLLVESGSTVVACVVVVSAAVMALLRREAVKGRAMQWCLMFLCWIIEQCRKSWEKYVRKEQVVR